MLLKNCMWLLKQAALYIPRKFCYKEYHFSCVIKPSIIITPGCISLKKNVYIGYHSRVQGIYHYNKYEYNPQIIIGKDVSIQQNLHLTSANRIEIGNNTAIAANVTITDIHHPYEDVDKPIELQDIIVKEVTIGSDCKIYNNVIILPGVHIGKHTTIGANSVVTIDIPDFSVAVGSPARIIKKYDFDEKKWKKVL